jgi:hypothetical protein
MSNNSVAKIAELEDRLKESDAMLDRVLKERSDCEKKLFHTILDNNKRMEMILASLGGMKGASRRKNRSRRGRRHSRRN